MKKFFKSMLILGGTAAAGYLGFKAYKKVSSIVRLSKALPEFLKNVYGESPKIHINMALNKVIIRTGFSQETIDKHDDIESTVREYVEDFFPSLGNKKLSIHVYVKGEEDEEDDDECCCCDDDDMECDTEGMDEENPKK
ncbi:MAG TPA: hypothetical protein PLE74_08220 [Candidatus Cloacimonadota bacterium]|nr:hypothetical protein [Candidatus Cloacimonadota bacterium]